jgi:hypothetical protein
LVFIIRGHQALVLMRAQKNIKCILCFLILFTYFTFYDPCNSNGFSLS